MDWATSDYANTYSDVYLSPEIEDEGVYLLEEVDAKKPVYDRGPYHPPVAYRNQAKIRMRGGIGDPSGDRGPYFPQESFSPNPRAPQPPGGSFQEYQQGMPSQTMLRSYQGGNVPPSGLTKREVITRSAWDGRPVGTRPDDGVVDSAFLPPYQLRPWSGGVRTPWQLNWAPPNSIAILTPTDPSMYGLASCNGIPEKPEKKPAWLDTPAAPGYSERFQGGPSGASEMCVIKLVLFFVVVILLGMLVVGKVVEKQLRGTVQQSVREALELRAVEGVQS